MSRRKIEKSVEKRSDESSTTTERIVGNSQKADRLTELDQQAFKFLSSTSATDAQKLKSSPAVRELRQIAGRNRKFFVRKWMPRIVISCLIICSFIYCICNSTAGLVALRYALVAVHPWWDWTSWYKTSCLISNPLFEDNAEPDTQFCAVCEDFVNVAEFVVHPTMDGSVAAHYLVEDLPVVFRKAVDPVSSALSVRSVVGTLLEHPTMAPCQFRTNYKTKRAFNFHSFLQALDKGPEASWFAFWEFCERSDVKETRIVVPRPLVVPSMLEVADSIWFFLSYKYSAVSFKQVPLSQPVIWIVQVSGKSYLRLIPKPECEEICHQVNVTLNPGDLFLTTTANFHLEWMPDTSAETLAVAAGAR